MLHILKIHLYIEILTDKKVKDFGGYFKCIKEEQSLRKFTKSLYIFQTTPDEVEIYVESNSC